MKLIIFGATGTVGRYLVEQALSQSHRVTAFARKPSALKLDHPNLTRQAGDVLDRDAVAEAVADHDAVLIALGAGRKGKVRSLGTKHVIDAMERRGLRRLVCQTTLGAGDPLPSWRDGPAKQKILSFVATITARGGRGFVPPQARIATFDNDGTLWVEKPTYTQVTFLFERVVALVGSKRQLR